MKQSQSVDCGPDPETNSTLSGKEQQPQFSGCRGDIPEELVRQLEEKLRVNDDPRAPYTPYLRAVHSRTRGFAQRLPSIEAPRVEEYLSRNEFHVRLMFEWQRDRYANVREQFSLPLDLTIEVARQEGIKHPWNRFEKRAATMSVDFMLTKCGGGWEAVDFKEKKDYAKPRTKEKLRLSEHTLALVGVPHRVMTEDDVHPVCIRNFRFLRIHQLPFDPPPISEDDIARVEPALRHQLRGGHTWIFDAAQAVSPVVGIDPDRLARTCYWLIANHRWQVDLHAPLGPDYPLKFLGRP